MSTTRRRGAILPAAVALALALGACSSDASSDSGGASQSSSPTTPSGTAEDAGPTSAEPFGAACAQVPAEGPGSFAGMSTVPVAAAAGSNPLLSTLVQAVTAADLGDSLDAQEDITVLAPADPAFQAIPADRLGAVLADVPQLTSILTHHVIQGRLAPAELAGQHTTLNNDTVTIEGSGEEFTISGEQTITAQPASVICGNVQTANATVYIIDQVLVPPAAG